MPETATVLMCRPEHFSVCYQINPWMAPDRPTNTARAIAQWEHLRDAYLALGVNVQLIDPLEGLPDMVYAANGAFVLDGIAYGARFAVAERAAEGPAYLHRLEELGFSPVVPREVNEGEGDLLVAGDVILGGFGFRTSPEAHCEVSAIFDREVLSLRLVNERFYHLDTALTVLPDGGIAYLPAAFDQASQEVLARRFHDAVIATEPDAGVLGLNSFGVGGSVVISAAATTFPSQLRDRGLTVISVDMSELMLGGGGIKCCTLELRQ